MDKTNLILIPVYNGAPTIEIVIKRINAVLQDKNIQASILVVNDGSTDSTAEVLKTLGILVIHHPVNRGKGAALKTGFAYAIENGFSAIITMDADGQHDPEAIPGMLNTFQLQKADIVMGSRDRKNSRMPMHRRFSNWMTSWLISRRARCWIPDSQSGYRVIRTAILADLNLRTNGYETESELLIRAGQKGYRFAFYPVPTLYHNEKSHIRIFRDTWRFIQMYFSI